MQRFFFELKYLAGNPPWDTGISPPELLAYLQEHQSGRSLDLGCGTGTNAITMAAKGWEVVGVDLSYLAIWAARRKARKNGWDILFKRGDVTQLNWIEIPFDLILDIGCYHALSTPGRMRYSQQAKRLSVADAGYLLYTFLSESLTISSIQSDFSPEFNLVSVEHGTDTSASGRQSAWLQFQRQAR